ncbi:MULTISPECIES: MEDS domain-containing protein [Halorussus]|uniref:MEDS domain-containing protein n=1 Tax=Halorussus TaxID=1070314 RepID=UPI000E2144AA|nr:MULTISPECIES: MEDS domain-containing protein [Halorussus]NHN58862.1 histidine kinase [Halorussus sp. JP-T4]
MSHGVGSGDSQTASDAESGVEALRRSPEIRGPVDPPDDPVHGGGADNDHLASIYADRDEQFAAVVPFVRQGLERGERCLYIADENSREEVLVAFRARGVDVDAALDSGALSVHTPAETYRRTGEFERDAMVEFWEDTLARATEDGEYAGVRAAAEMTWALDDGTDPDLLVEYEAVLNTVFSGEEYVVLCQYNDERFPAEVVRDVIRTHPHVVSDCAVHHNSFYTPPEEYFGPDDPARDVERMMGAMRNRTEMKASEQERHRYLRRQYEIAGDTDRTFSEKLQALFELGCERFDLELGGLARIDPETDLFEVEAVSGDHDHLVPGARLALSETYCRVLADDADVTGITDPADDGFTSLEAYEEFGVRTYLGTRIELSGGLDRTLFFVSSEPRDEEFSDAERTFHQLMGQWVKYEFETDRHKARLESKNDRLESFANMLAHELRNPVTIGEIYSRQLPDNADDEAVDYVTDAFDRIEDMIDVMLVLTKGREAVDECEPVDLAEAAREAWDGIDAPDASLAVSVDRTIRADETYVRHLFRNLFENAVEHGLTSPRSGAREGAVEHGGSDVSVTVGTLPTGFYVADDGLGISAGDRDVVFEVGFTTASANGGTGLGLAFVGELADVYGWDVAVTESEAGGARFEFRNVERDE